MKFEEKELPPITEKDAIALINTEATQHFTEPPPRYNEASLIKVLEANGIGRPSTYAPIISVIQDREYVEKNQGRFYPTEIGTLVNKVLVENFPDVVDITFTAKMEDTLDDVAEGKEVWQKAIKEFYDPFAKLLEKKYEEVSKEKLIDEKTDLICEKCGKPMIIKFGRFGKFIACSGYPECKTTIAIKEPPKTIGLKCPKCTEGDVIERRVSKKGRARGKIFWGCSNYPKCDYASWTNPLEPEKKKDEEEKTSSEKDTEEREEESLTDLE
jgi:DNA topoisomerase-1